MVVCFFLLLFLSTPTHAEVSALPESTELEVDTDIVEEAPPVQQSVGSRRLVDRKEVEGSQAPRGFEGETFIKSIYTQNGRQLDVDPD